MITGTENSKGDFAALIENCKSDEHVIHILSNESITQHLPYEVFLKIFSAHSTLPLESELLQKLNPEYLPTLASYNTKIADHILKTPALLDKLDRRRRLREQLLELSGGDKELIKSIILQYLGYLERDPTLRQRTEKHPARDQILQNESYQRGRNSARSDFWDSVRGSHLCSLAENSHAAADFVLSTEILLDKVSGYDLVLLANSPDNVEQILSMMQENEQRVAEKVDESWYGRTGDFYSELLKRGSIETVEKMLSQKQIHNALTGYNLVTLSGQSPGIASHILSDKVLRDKLTFCDAISLYLRHAGICCQVVSSQLKKISTGTKENEALCLGYLLCGYHFAHVVPDIMRTLASSEAERSFPNNYHRPPHFTYRKHNFHDAKLDKMDVTLADYMFSKLRSRLIALQKSLRPIRMQDWESVYPLSYAQTYDFSQATQESEKATQCLVWLYGLSYLYPNVAKNIVCDPALRATFKEQGLLSRVCGFHEQVADLTLKKPEWWQEFNPNDFIHLGEYHTSIAREIFSNQSLIEKSPQERLSVLVALSRKHPQLIEEHNLLSDKVFSNQLRLADIYVLVARGTMNTVKHSIENKKEWERRFRSDVVEVVKIAEEKWDFYQSVMSLVQAKAAEKAEAAEAQLLKAAEAARQKAESSKDPLQELVQELDKILSEAPVNRNSPQSLAACSSSRVRQFSEWRVEEKEATSKPTHVAALKATEREKTEGGKKKSLSP